jgi:hypothetical protein
VVNSPGSLRVLDRQTGRLEECTQSLCPYAKLLRTYDGREMRVNQVEPATGFSGYINARQDPVKQQAMCVRVCMSVCDACALVLSSAPVRERRC